MSRELTDFQVEVARVFFSIPESEGFLVAGGAALIAQELVTRQTRDLDMFSGPRPSVAGTVVAFEQVAAAHGWTCTRLRDGVQFVRLLVGGPEQLILDIGVDAPPARPSVICSLGPSYDPLELGARKLLALYDRAEPRDFTDVHSLAQRFGKDQLYDLARDLDLGLTRERLALAFRSIARLRDADFPVPATAVPEIRAFFQTWQDELSDP